MTEQEPLPRQPLIDDLRAVLTKRQAEAWVLREIVDLRNEQVAERLGVGEQAASDYYQTADDVLTDAQAALETLALVRGE
jgi:predicted DNA-binding protein YlxM (UPF0122 family)